MFTNHQLEKDTEDPKDYYEKKSLMPKTKPMGTIAIYPPSHCS